VTEAGDMADEDLVRAEGVPVRASVWGFCHPCAVDGADQLPLVHARDFNPHHRL